MAGLNFNADDMPDDDGFSLIEPGVYIAQIISSELKETSSGGEQLSLRYKLDDVEANGKFKNRTVFANLNIKNKNEKAVQISQAQLKKIMQACGLKQLRDSSQLHDQSMQIKIGIQKASEADKANGYEDRNQIKGFAPLNGGGGGKSPASGNGGAKGSSAPWS